MITRENALSKFFMTRFQISGLCVRKVVVYTYQIRIYVANDAVKMSELYGLREVLGWTLDKIWADSGDLVFSYQ